MRAFYFFWTLDWWRLEYFYFKDKLPVNSWGLEIVSGSFSWAPRESGCSCPWGERCGVYFPEHWCCAVLYPHIPDCSLGESVPDPFFWSGTKWQGWFRKGFAWRIQPGSSQCSPTHWTSEGILQSGKGETPGGTECPQLSLESAGLRSLIPQAQSRYGLIERCPAEKDLSFSSQ